MKKVLVKGFVWVTFLSLVLLNSAYSSTISNDSADPAASKMLVSESGQVLEVAHHSENISAEAWEPLSGPNNPKSHYVMKAAEMSGDISEEAWEFQPASAPSQTDHKIENKKEPEDVSGELWPIPADLESDYHAVTGEKGEGKIDMGQFANEIQTDKPRFKVILPGAAQTPESPNEVYSRNEMPDTLLNGEAPLYKGGRIIRNEIFGENHSLELVIPATPEEIFEYYKTSMTAKGWLMGISMKEKESALLFFSKGEEELVFRIEKRGKESRVTINMVGKEDFQPSQHGYGEP